MKRAPAKYIGVYYDIATKKVRWVRVAEFADELTPPTTPGEALKLVPKSFLFEGKLNQQNLSWFVCEIEKSL